MRHELCSEPWHGGTFIGEAIAISIGVLLQSSLFLHAIYNHCIKHRDGENQTAKHAVLYMILVVLGLYFLIIDTLRFVIDPYLPFSRHSILCDVFAYSVRIAPFYFYCCYLLQILFRLEVSFKGSYLAVSNYFVWTMSIIILLHTLILSPVYIGNVDVCSQEWYPNDIDDRLLFCSLPLSELNTYVVYLNMLFVITENVLFGCLFIIKLRPIMQHSPGQKVEFEFKSLIIKVECSSIV